MVQEGTIHNSELVRKALTGCALRQRIAESKALLTNQRANDITSTVYGFTPFRVVSEPRSIPP